MHAPPIAKLRPAKIVRALRRRRFEWELNRIPLDAVTETVALGSSYGGWRIPLSGIDEKSVCYCVGMGADISFDLELIQRFGATVRAFDAVERFVSDANSATADEARYVAHHAAIAPQDGPLRVQRSHDPVSRSVSAAGLYESSDYDTVPGRSIASLMEEFGDQRIDLFKLDVEGFEYELIEHLDLRALGVQIFSVQLHHNRSVADAKRLIASVRQQGMSLVACRPQVKLTFERVS